MAFFKKGQLIERFQSVVTSNGTTTLIVNSPKETRFTGTLDHTVKLPDATTLTLNQVFAVRNMSEGVITVNDNGNNLIGLVQPGIQLDFHITDISSANGAWEYPLSGGGGAGDANSFLEDLKARSRDTDFKWFTPNIFQTSKQTLIDAGNSTATYDSGKNLYKLESGQTLRSIQLFGARFLASDLDCPEAEVHLLYDTSGIDTAPSVYISRNGGTQWNAVTMTHVGASDKFYGSLTFPTESPLQVLSTYAFSNIDNTVVLNATTSQQIAQKFTVAAKQNVKQIQLQTNKLGSPVGSFNISIVKDNAGQPSTAVADIVYTTSYIPLSGIAAGANTFSVDLSQALIAGNYWIVIGTDNVYKTNVFGTNAIRFGSDASAPTATVASTYNGTAWSSLTAALGYIVSGITYDLRVRIDSSMNGTKLLGFGVFFAKQEVGTVVTDIPNIHREIFSGDLNTYQFTLPFTPDPDALVIYDVNTQASYVYPAFDIAGNVVSFLPGTFLSPGETVSLKFDQTTGGGFDNSDMNRNLLAANHLGNTFAGNSLQSPGRGILIADETNILKEVAIDSNRGLMILDPSTLQVLDYHYGAADNGLYNTDFFYTQRNENKSYSGFSGYLADRWYRENSFGSATPNFTQVVANPAVSVFSSIRFGKISSSTSVDTTYIKQALTTKDSIRYAGKMVCFSFIAKKGADFSGSNLNLRVVFGQGTDQSIAFGWTNQSTLDPLIIPAASLSTSLFQKFYVVFQVPAATTQLGFLLRYTPVGIAGANDWVEVSQIMFHEGRGPAKWSLKGKSYEGELFGCQAFYEKTFEQGVSPGSIVTTGSLSGNATGTGVGSVNINVPYRNKKIKSATPVVYNPNTGATGSMFNSGGSVAADAYQAGMYSATIRNSASGVVNGNQYTIQLAVDAEL